MFIRELKRSIPAVAIGEKIWPLYEQLSIFFLFYWPHLGLNEDLP